MPCIWGRHDNSQIFLNVAIFDDSILNRLVPADTHVAVHTFTALVDTGAQSTCITREAAERVGINPVGVSAILGVSGRSYHNDYLFRVGFAFGMEPEQKEHRIAALHIVNKTIKGTELNASGGKFQVLLGMDVIGLGSLKIDGDGSFSFSF
jgi:hypothetical protein